MTLRIGHIVSIMVAIAIFIPCELTVIAGKVKEVKELTLSDIQPGPRFRWPSGDSSGAGRWVVKDGKFGLPGAGYFDADEQPAIFTGRLPGADTKEETLQWSNETTHVLIGKNVLKGFTFDSDPKYPLTFKLIREKGYVYLCGRGIVTDKSGNGYRLGYTDTVDTWLPHLHSDNSLRAEAAAQALGYLTTSTELKNKGIPELIAATKSEQFGVYWNATEALGRIGDSRALSALEELKAKGGFIGRLAEESIQKIKGGSR